MRTRDGGFDPARYEVERLDGDAIAKAYCLTHHYSGTYPAAQHRYGLYLTAAERDLVGVAVFSVPASLSVITRAFPDLDYTSACELGRLVLEGPPHQGTGRAPANAESWFVARCLADLAGRGVRGVIAFSDPVPRRTADGRTVLPGHTGVVYTALNMTYTGRGTARYLTVLPDGRSISDRALQKVRARERGHEYVERRLIGLGAAVPRAGQDPADWLVQALEDVSARRIRHRGNHRYVTTLGQTRRDRAGVRVALPALPAPRLPDAP